MDWSAGYREYAPPRALAHALSCVWVSVTPAGGAPPTRVLPDACTDLIWRAGTGLSLARRRAGPAGVPRRDLRGDPATGRQTVWGEHVSDGEYLAGPDPAAVPET